MQSMPILGGMAENQVAPFEIELERIFNDLLPSNGPIYRYTNTKLSSQGASY